jgi:hypothetical protein
MMLLIVFCGVGFAAIEWRGTVAARPSTAAKARRPRNAGLRPSILECPLLCERKHPKSNADNLNPFLLIVASPDDGATILEHMYSSTLTAPKRPPQQEQAIFCDFFVSVFVSPTYDLKE